MVIVDADDAAEVVPEDAVVEEAAECAPPPEEEFVWTDPGSTPLYATKERARRAITIAAARDAVLPRTERPLSRR